MLSILTAAETEMYESCKQNEEKLKNCPKCKVMDKKYQQFQKKAKQQIIELQKKFQEV